MVEIPNSFIQTHVQHKKYMAIINIRGVMLNILIETAPDIYETYVTTYLKRVKQLVLQFQNSIYRTMMESMLYYQKFSKSLELKGYEFNLY